LVNFKTSTTKIQKKITNLLIVTKKVELCNNLYNNNFKTSTTKIQKKITNLLIVTKKVELCNNLYNNSNNNNNRVKVRFTLEQVMKAHWDSSGTTLFFFFGADWGAVVKDTPRSLYPRKRPGTY